MERPEGLAHEGVAGIGAGGDGGEGEARVERGGEVFERVDGEIDAAGGERFFDFLDEDALAVETRGRDEAGVLHAVAGGADDFDFDGVARGAEEGGDVVGLPEGELRAPGADADLGHGSVQNTVRGLGKSKGVRKGRKVEEAKFAEECRCGSGGLWRGR